MSFNVDKWTKRISNRSDLTLYLSHLTRSQVINNEKLDSVGVLLQILSEGVLRGSDTQSGFISGQQKAVCFQDTPLYGISQNVLHEQVYRQELGGQVRYEATGLMFPKHYIYGHGGRPVIYEKPEIARRLIPDKNEWWRIVAYDLSDTDRIVDWTHEREWRMKGDFKFELEKAYILLTNQSAYKKFISRAPSELIGQIGGIICLQPSVF